MSDLRQEIVLAIQKALSGLTSENIEFLVEKPENESFGDYSSNVGLVAGKILKQNPFDLALKLAEKIIKPEAIEKIDAVRPGFLNFYISQDYLLSQLVKILEEKEKFGSKKDDLNKKVVVEYSSPNIAKPFTIGHLRSTIIGDAIANLLEASGVKVFRDNHLGDWGTQFGKQIYAIKTWGDEEKIEKSEKPVRELVSLYVRFHEEAERDPKLEDEGRRWFKKLEEGDLEARRLWEKCINWSLKEFKEIYEKLGVTFTENNGLGYGESFFEDKMTPVVKELEDKNLLKTGEEGAKLFFFEKDKFPPLMILKQDGTSLYSTRDLATDKFRLEQYGKSVKVINEVGVEQQLYFKQLYEIERILGWYKEGQRIHKRHGHYRFKDAKMSTRKGNAIWLEDVLSEAEKRALEFSSEKDREISRMVAMGAIKWNDLKRTSEQDIVFDWDEVLNMQGDSGPYIQYAYVRTQSVLNKSHPELVSGSLASRQVSSVEMLKQVQHDKIMDEELILLRALNSFPEAVGEAAESLAPNILCNYLFDLAQKFSLFYQKCKIIGSDKEDFRLQLTAGVGQVIKNGLKLLGIQAPEKM